MTMKSPNYDQASDYMDSLATPKSRSAAIAIHLTWMNYFNSPDSVIADKAKGLDILLLYQAMVDTFDCSSTAKQTDYDATRRVGNDEYGSLTVRLKSVESTTIRSYAEKFVNHLCDAKLASVDIDSYLALFLECVHSEKVLDSINSGLISEKSDELKDPNNW